MPSGRPRKVPPKVLGKVSTSRRVFVKRLIAGTFATPMVTSFSLDRLTFGGVSTAFAQRSNFIVPPGSNIFCED